MKNLYERITEDFVFGATDTTKSATIYFRGELKNLALKMPNFTNAVTGTLTLEDEDNITIWTQAAIPKNADTPYAVASYTGGNKFTVTLLLSGVPGGTGGTATLVLHARGDI